MAFKTITKYNEDKNGDFFTLADDGDWADVVFLYRSIDDELVAGVHYIKTAEYTGYVQCCEDNCPACAKGIRVQNKIFIPLYNISKNKIEFWDRSTFMDSQLKKDVFDNYPNPSEYVFRITRHGEARSRETTYEIIGKFKNSSMPYEKILADNGVALPEYYESVCRDFSRSDLARMLSNNSTAAPTQESPYGAVPRQTSNSFVDPSEGIPTPDPVTVPAPDYGFEAPTDLPTSFGDADSDGDLNDSLDDPQF